MRYDEFAFFNQQLGAMLKEGLPLEGSLHQLCLNLQNPALKQEVNFLEADLKNGLPLQQALAPRKLPEFYKHMVSVGVASGDLPGVLLLLADHYRQVDGTWMRLKGLMVYPLLVLIAAFGLSCLLNVICRHVLSTFLSSLPLNEEGLSYSLNTTQRLILSAVWVPPIVTGLLVIVVATVLCVPSFKKLLRWRLPAFKEAGLAQVGSAMSLMLGGGTNLGDALSILEKMEQGTPASSELESWHTRLKRGESQFTDQTPTKSKAFPPLFFWLVSNAGEDLAGGFRRASEVYHKRAVSQVEILLYAALPFCILLLGIMIILQVLPVFMCFTSTMNFMSG